MRTTRRPLVSAMILASAVAALAALPADAAKVAKITVPKSAATLAMASVDFQQVHLTNLRANGQSISQPVAPGSTVQISFDVSLSEVPGCPACVMQVYLGFQGTAATCFIPTGAEGDIQSRSVALTAPDKPGTYPVMVNETLENDCDPAVTSGGGGLPSIAAIVSTIKVK